MSETLRKIYYEVAPNHLDSGDRGTVHSYIPLYEALLAPYQKRAEKVLELGIAEGHGMVVWSQYFTSAEVHGVDIHDRWAFGDQVPSVRRHTPVDMTVEKDMAPILDHGPWDVVFEDGSHRLGEQVRTLELVWPSVRPGGLYVIEDVAEPDALRHLLRTHRGWRTLIDMRSVKGRYDDVVAVLYKEV